MAKTERAIVMESMSALYCSCVLSRVGCYRDSLTAAHEIVWNLLGMDSMCRRVSRSGESVVDKAPSPKLERGNVSVVRTARRQRTEEGTLENNQYLQ